MSLPMPNSSASRFALACFALCLLAGAFAPVARAADEHPARVAFNEKMKDVLEHRVREAALKEELYRGLFEAQSRETTNQSDYDVVDYDLVLDLNLTTHILTGSVGITAEVLGASIAVMELDLWTGMVVSSVTSGGVGTTFSHGSNLLTVDLDQTYTTGQTVTVVVNYSGNPGNGPQGAWGWDSNAGMDMIWTLSEPYGAADWWPCKNVNTDKPETVTLAVTVPDNGLIVASNGLLTSDVDNGATRTFTWHTDYPIATYLVSLAIHPYTVWTQDYTPMGGGGPMLVQHFVFPGDFAASQPNFSLVVPMITALRDYYGEYPFVNEKYGHAMFTWGGGMEHQTLTSIGGWWEDVVSHELGHMWWGDQITCEDFGHIWLNEGFATWTEAVWKELTEGVDVYRQYMDGAAYYGSGTIIVEDPYNDNIFSTNLSYNKASWVVHMLRGVLGDTDFFAGLQLYQATYGGATATTEQFRDIMESVSGKDLDQYFQQWIYGEYFPHYSLGWSQAGSTVTVVVEQIQTNTGLFTMPINLRVTTDQGVQDFWVDNSLALTEYEFEVTGTAEGVAIDPDGWILKRVETQVTNPTFLAGILLVNGVDWDTYSPEIQNAYLAEAFWGDNPIDFWDTFAEPGGGYPGTLPAPIGHGAVPAEILGQYSTVIWVGNNYNGDLPKWADTPIASYLEVGGNVLLMTRQGLAFIDEGLRAHLGITWTSEGVSLNNFTAQYLGLVNILFTGTQSFIDVFSPTVDPSSTLLFKDTAGNRGVGVHGKPGPGTFREDGARFIYMACRPYRMNNAQLRSDVEFILEHFFGEPYSSVAAGDAPVPASLALRPNFPNPFNPYTTIPYSLPKAGNVELAVYDVTGRLVRVLVAEEQTAGEKSAVWTGLDGSDRPVASGVYYARLRTEGEILSKSLVLLR